MLCIGFSGSLNRVESRQEGALVVLSRGVHTRTGHSLPFLSFDSRISDPLLSLESQEGEV